MTNSQRGNKKKMVGGRPKGLSKKEINRRRNSLYYIARKEKRTLRTLTGGYNQSGKRYDKLERAAYNIYDAFRVELGLREEPPAPTKGEKLLMFILGVGEEVRAYRKKGINRAIAILKPLIRNNPTGWQLYALLGYAYEHKGRFSGGQSDSLKAIEYYKKALKFAKNQKLLIYRLLYSAYESMVVRPMHATGKGNDKKLRQYAKKALNTLNKMLCLKPTLKGFYSKEARELQDWAQYSLK